MSVFSSSSRGEPPPRSADEHPAASIVTATADATSRLRDFILAPSGSAASHATRDRLGGTVPGSGDRLRTMVMMFRTVRHMPNGTTCPDLVALCYQY
jgi:hypothetical protein